MRCKPGDLAVIVSSHSGLDGTIVRVIRLHDSTDRDLDGARCFDFGPRWVLEKPVMVWAGFRKEPCHTYPDNALRPIRDPGDDARDEMLRPLPHEVPA